MAIIHSAIHDLLIIYFYVTHSLKRMIRERIRDVVVIDSRIHNLLLLLCNSLAEA